MPSIAFSQLTKTYGSVTALDGLTAEISAGRITAFLGANGSGKTTSMRLLLGLSEPDAGRALIGGVRYRDLPAPLRTVGAVLDQGFHPNRTGRNHLRVVAEQARAPHARIDEVLAQLGLTDAAQRRVSGYSLGMRQRLAMAAALVGDPDVLVLDEPFNGLDPDGIATSRHFLRQFADAGGTVLLSSHLLAEVAHSADDVIIIDRGRLVSAGPLRDLAVPSAAIAVTSTDAEQLGAALRRRGAGVERTGPDSIVVRGLTREDVGRTAAGVGVVVTELRTSGDDLESVFHALIHRTDRQEVSS